MPLPLKRRRQNFPQALTSPMEFTSIEPPPNLRVPTKHKRGRKKMDDIEYLKHALARAKALESKLRQAQKDHKPLSEKKKSGSDF